MEGYRIKIYIGKMEMIRTNDDEDIGVEISMRKV